jgi:hypothetical protein
MTAAPNTGCSRSFRQDAKVRGWFPTSSVIAASSYLASPTKYVYAVPRLLGLRNADL